MTIDDLINSLDYNPKVLLSVTPDGDTTTQSAKTRNDDDSSAVIVTTKTQHKLSKSLSDVAILQPTAGVVFPGALVLADGNLMDGQPTPIGLERAPLTLSTDLPGLGQGAIIVRIAFSTSAWT
jgi:thiol-activated cytolysin